MAKVGWLEVVFIFIPVFIRASMRRVWTWWRAEDGEFSKRICITRMDFQDRL